MNLPPCANWKAGSCERNDVFVSKETDTAFVIACRTCKSISVWPKERNENEGRYTAWLKRKAALEAQERASKRAYSFGGTE